MKKWQLQSKTEVQDIDQLLKVLLTNRQIKASQAADFFHPKPPQDWQLKELGFDHAELIKIQKRLAIAKEKKEKVLIRKQHLLFPVPFRKELHRHYVIQRFFR